ncbi:MAG: hypothetical protein GX443_09375 [Deltaproteobacteria bacterium]|nr:hypothetical protein [Deltaproteobacteria bacterium]
MRISLNELKLKGLDYYWAHAENGELVMEPSCACGTPLEEDYYCPNCQRKCDCRFIACEDVEILQAVERLIRGNPSFRDYQAMVLNR